jgi:adenosylmethionine-8-amino-7-oxononanoate aminotransferase
VIETEHPVDLEAATAAALEHGVWLRPFRNLVYAMPPYVATELDLRSVARAMVAAAAASRT